MPENKSRKTNEGENASEIGETKKKYFAPFVGIFIRPIYYIYMYAYRLACLNK